MANRSIICQSRRPRQIIDLRDEFNNCFIIRPPSLGFVVVVVTVVVFGKRLVHAALHKSSDGTNKLVSLSA